MERSLSHNPSLRNILTSIGDVADGVIEGRYSPSQGTSVASLTRSMVMVAQLASESERLAVMQELLEKLDGQGLEPLEDDDDE